MGDIVPREEMTRQGVRGVGGVAGGVGVLIVRAIAMNLPIVGGVIGGIVALAGLAMLRKHEDRTAGIVAIVGGGLTLLASIGLLGTLAGGALLFSGIGLLLAGGWSLFKFIRNLRKRG